MVGNTEEGIININYKAIVEVLKEVYFKVIAKRNNNNNNLLLNVRFGSLLGPRGLLLMYMWGENSI